MEKDLIMDIQNLLQLQDSFIYDLSKTQDKLNAGLLLENYYWLNIEI